MHTFRTFETSLGKMVLLGKSAENNEQLIEQVEPGEVVLHTAAPGSPFANIKGEATKEDVNEAAVFTAAYSQDWRDYRRDVVVHVFRGADVYKEKKMKTGTFGVKTFDEVRVKKTAIMNFLEGQAKK